ncbi:hypothetical protein [Stratiformator vulcanicus]|uniref:Uncharacterized protein n=1 Tax=Stratiformator vulcanicus TaxID=2527980 RepID=A0A517R1A1_9PLAN|nr:hypothetical protein [Stratiformator vulcanicus]QDT37669.1 hypothetical protein Pan189_20500 [Stratiformator vulcanicus]
MASDTRRDSAKVGVRMIALAVAIFWVCRGVCDLGDYVAERGTGAWNVSGIAPYPGGNTFTPSIYPTTYAFGSYDGSGWLPHSGNYWFSRAATCGLGILVSVVVWIAAPLLARLIITGQADSQPSPSGYRPTTVDLLTLAIACVGLWLLKESLGAMMLQIQFSMISGGTPMWTPYSTGVLTGPLTTGMKLTFSIVLILTSNLLARLTTSAWAGIATVMNLQSHSDSP